MGITPEAIANGVPTVYLIASILLLGTAVIGQRRQLRTYIVASLADNNSLERMRLSVGLLRGCW